MKNKTNPEKKEWKREKKEERNRTGTTATNRHTVRNKQQQTDIDGHFFFFKGTKQPAHHLIGTSAEESGVTCRVLLITATRVWRLWTTASASKDSTPQCARLDRHYITPRPRLLCTDKDSSPRTARGKLATAARQTGQRVRRDSDSQAAQSPASVGVHRAVSTKETCVHYLVNADSLRKGT